VAEYIGGILIPEPTKSGTFPLSWEFGAVEVHDPVIDSHRFGSGETLIEQHYYRGTGQRRFRLTFSELTIADRTSLLDFFTTHLGSYHTFTVNLVTRTGGSEAITARLAEPILSFEQAADWAYSAGLDLIQVPTSTPTYTVASTETRFPGSSLKAALLSQVQEVIPLLKLGSSIYLSDRRCTVGGTLYQPRILDWDNIEQRIDGAADNVTFTLGNADRVFTQLAAATELRGLPVVFSLYHVGTGIKIDLWGGDVQWFGGETTPEFRLQCWDPLADPRHAYPRRVINRADGFDPGAQPVNLGGKKGVSPITATSIRNDTAYGKPLKDIWVDNATYPLPVIVDLICFRDEREFAAGLGVCGRGPTSGFYSGSDYPHTLDNQAHHGPGNLGLRRAYGGTPATGDETAADNSPDAGSDSFALDEVGQPLPVNPLNGVSFMQIRRTDEPGIQPVRAETHSMVAYYTGGLGCWTWTAPGSRSWTIPCTNPIWIAVNTYLNYLGLMQASASTQEALFDCAQAISDAAFCDELVDKIIGEGQEKRFAFAGVVGADQQRPLRDVLSELLATCCGNFTWAVRKFRPLIRRDSGVDEAFTIGNIVHDSLQLSALRDTVNDYTVAYADPEYGYQQATIYLDDADDIAARGRKTGHRNLLGACSKSQAARVCTVEMREKLGGVTAEERRYAREIAFKTTVLALNTEVGQCISVTHDDMPGGSGEARIVGWRLNRDMSVDIEAVTTADSMYDMLQGEVPVDVSPDEPPTRTVYDVRPGDVSNLEATVTEDGSTAVIEVSYDPPSPVGVFAGTSPSVEIPQGSGKLYPQGDHDDNEAHTFTLRISQPVNSDQTWRVYVPSRSTVVRNPLDTSNTPYVDISVNQSSGESRSNSNNLVYDPSFDQGDAVWDSGGDGTVRWVEATDQYHTPYKSRSYTGAPSMSGKYAALSGFNNGYVEATKDRLYTVSCWVRANAAATGTLSLSIMGLSEVGQWRGVVANADQDVAALADDTWIELRASAYLIDGLTRYIYPQIAITSGTAGKVWVDDVDLREHEPDMPAVVGNATASFQVLGATDNSILSETGQECYRLRVYSIALPNDLNLVTFRIGYDRDDDSNTEYTDYTGPLALEVSEHKSDPWLKTSASFTIRVRIVGVNRDNVETALWTSSPVTVAPSGSKNIPGTKITDATIPWSAAATAAGMTNTVNAVPDGNGYLAISKTSETVFNTYNGRLYIWSTSLGKYKPKVDKGDFNTGCIDSYLIFANAVVTNNVLAGSITTTKILAGLFSGFTLYLEQNGVISQFYSAYDAGMGAYIGFKTHRVSDGLACKMSYGGIWVVAQSYLSTPLLWLGVPTAAYPTLGWQLPAWGGLLGIGNPIGAMYLNVFIAGIFTVGISTCKSQQFVDSTGKRLLGGRVTGWSLPTGVSVRSSWATSTVTLEQLAGAVKALIEDLYGTDGESTYPVKAANLLGP
jgi:hypothetical protein